MKSLNLFETLGAALTIAGSFLPWEMGGGFLGLVTYGVRINAAGFKYWVNGMIHEFPVYDQGGLLVILLTVAFILIALHPPRLIRKPNLWNLIISSVLMASSLFFVARWALHLYEYGSTVEQPTLMLGLVCVVSGSMLLWSRALITYRRTANYSPERRLTPLYFHRRLVS